MDSEPPPNIPIKSDRTLFNILDGLHELGGAGVTELADHVGVNKSTVHKHLKSLEQYNWVESVNGEYSIGLKFLTYGGKKCAEMPLYSTGVKKINKLSHETGLTCSILVRENNKVVSLATNYGNYEFHKTLPIGTRLDLYSCSPGKAILSTYSDEKICEIFKDYEMEKYTKNTVDSLDELMEDINACRDHGYAINQGERREGWGGISVPVDGDGLSCVAALAMSGPVSEIKGDKVNKYHECLQTAKNELFLDLHYE